MNEFVPLSWRLRNTWNLNFDFKFQVSPDYQDRKTNSSVFIGEEAIMAHKWIGQKNGAEVIKIRDYFRVINFTLINGNFNNKRKWIPHGVEAERWLCNPRVTGWIPSASNLEHTDHRWMAKPPKYTVGACQSARMSYVCDLKKTKSNHI